MPWLPRLSPLDAEGMPVVGDERVIMPISDPVDDSHVWKHSVQCKCARKSRLHRD